jgi:hypothetical protein
MLNETLAFDSDDEKICTGTETRPNEMVAVAIFRAGMENPQFVIRGARCARGVCFAKKGRSFAALRMTWVGTWAQVTTP